MRAPWFVASPLAAFTTPYVSGKQLAELPSYEFVESLTLNYGGFVVSKFFLAARIYASDFFLRLTAITKRLRLHYPFFFDPNFNAEVKRIELNTRVDDDSDERWDRASVHDFSGTYGDYLLSKVSRVFPQLRREVL